MKHLRPPVMLIVLDGFGTSPLKEGNAIWLAKTPTFDKLERLNRSTLIAGGEEVGLPKGQMGNSEVGHTNMGCGRIVLQDFPRISKSIQEGTFFKNVLLKETFSTLKKKNNKLHILGLLSDGGVHSHIDHLTSLLRFAKQEELSKVYVHAFLDGRDTPPTSALHYIRTLKTLMSKEKIGLISTVAGRFYAMDRDKRWERLELAYNAMVLGHGEKAPTAEAALTQALGRGETDEFVKPTVIDQNGLIDDNDVCIFFNFRADRARQLTMALSHDHFSEFKRAKFRHLFRFLTMTRYHKDFTSPIIFPQEHFTHVLGEVLSGEGIPQLRIAETEKYAHVTFFFNGGEEKVFAGEERILIPSPREVPTYDLKPEMSAWELTETVIKNIEKNEFGFILLNFANADMVGHTGNLKATIKAVEVLDQCIARIIPPLQSQGGHLFITADHGNAEQMIDPKTKMIHTAHTTHPVPLYVVPPNFKRLPLANGILADIAPTILKVLEIDQPREMTGHVLC